MTADVTVVIPTIPPRVELAERALVSVMHQTMRARYVVEADPGHTGSAATRNRALARVETEWVLWLDDDDQLMPNAVQLLVEAQQHNVIHLWSEHFKAEADYRADVVSGRAWIPQHRDHAEPTEVPPGWLDRTFVQYQSRLHVTALMRTELARKAGGFEFRTDPATGMELDDYGLYWKLAEAGALFFRIPEAVLIWNVHGANTSGRPDRW